MKSNTNIRIIRRKARRSYRSTSLTPTVARKQVEFLADVALCMRFKRRFFSKFTKQEHERLKALMTGLYVVGFEAAGGEVK